MTKTCSKCKLDKPLTAFGVLRSSSDGLKSHCKDCIRAYRKANNAQRVEYNRKWIAENPDRASEYQRQYGKENRDRLRIYHSQWAKDNADHLAEYARKYRLANSDLIRAGYVKRRVNPKRRALSMWSAAQKRAADRGLEFTVTFERIHDALLNGVCERTGIEFDLNPHPIYNYHPFAPSLDKIDPFGGYTPGNVQVVCNLYNIGKQQMTDQQFVEFCRIVVAANS